MLRIDRPGGVELYLEHVVMPQSVACGRHEALAAQQKVKTALIARRFGPGARLLHTPEGAPRIEGAELNLSLSHCATVAAMAVGPSPLRVGVDAEGSDRYGQLSRHRAGTDSQHLFNLIHQFKGISGLPVHLINKCKNRNMAHNADLKQLNRLGLYTFGTINYHDG